MGSKKKPGVHVKRDADLSKNNGSTDSPRPCWECGVKPRVGDGLFCADCEKKWPFVDKTKRKIQHDRMTSDTYGMVNGKRKVIM